MSENTFIKKRQKERARPFLTLRIILGLIFLSGIIWAGFYFEYGSIGNELCDGDCENLHSLRASVLGFFMIFIGIIAAGAVVGGLFATLKWSRNKRNDTLSSLISEAQKD